MVVRISVLKDNIVDDGGQYWEIVEANTGG
jgi:hypothetical protein